MIACAEKGCLATVSWFGHPTDPALATVARQSGWTVFESKGWLCKRHAPNPLAEIDRLNAEAGV